MEKKTEIWNKNHQKDAKRALKHTRRYLSILGIWPLVTPTPNKLQTYLSIVWIPACFLFGSFIIVPASTYTILIERDLLNQLITIGPISFAIANVTKLIAMVYHRKDIRQCIEHLQYDWRTLETEDHRKIMIRNGAIGDNLSTLCAIFMYSSGFSYNTIMPLVEGVTINEFNVTIRPLNYPGYELFYDRNKTPYYELTYFTICFAAFLLLSITTSTCNIAATFVTHICGQIEIITSRLERFFDDNDGTDEAINRRIGVIVRSHNRVLRLTSMTEDVLREICFAEITSSILVICLVEYYCLMTLSGSDILSIMTYFVLLLSLIFNVAIFCIISEILTGQCAHISEVAYMMEWYRFPGKSGLALVVIIAMADIPRKLTAGGMIDLSIYSFGSLIKSTVVYLNMLRTMAD